MKEFVEKLIGRLEEETYDMEICEEQFDMNSPYFMDVEYKMVKIDDIKEIVNQLAEEYNNGWIPVSERFPSKEEYLKNDGRFIVTDGNRCYQSVFDIYSQKFRTSIFTTFGSYKYEEDKCVIAWQPLPAPYQKGE